MELRAYTPFLLAIVVIVAVLGMPLLLLAPVEHRMGCPFTDGSTAMCTMVALEHLTRWQATFAMILVELLMIAAFALFAIQRFELMAPFKPSFARIRLRARAPTRPTLLQEIFSSGILNPKSF